MKAVTTDKGNDGDGKMSRVFKNRWCERKAMIEREKKGAKY